jgi:iron complex transport system substrate-binding protein
MNKTVFGIAVMASCVLLAFVPANASDFTLPIFGNANMDDTIDELDIEYVQGIIDGAKEMTQLADANYDGKIDKDDMAQIDLIILGEEKKLTYIDNFGEAETINEPIERLANLGLYGIQVARMIDAEDILLPVIGGSTIPKLKVFYSKFCNWPTTVNGNDIDFEYILSLNPDTVQPNLEMQTYPPSSIEKKRVYQKGLPGMQMISLDFRTPNDLSRNVMTYGYILGKRDEAKKFIDWYDNYMTMIKTRVEGIPDEKKPRFYVTGEGNFGDTKTSKDRRAQAIEIAGGQNIVDDLINMTDPESATAITVETEWVMKQNPDYIFRIVHPGTTELSGYELNDTAPLAAVRQKIIDMPELAQVKAVVNGNVYIIDGHLDDGGGNNIIGSAYAAKLFYPDLFKDLDPEDVHQEYVDRFCHFDFDVKKQGVFFYPPLNDN